MTTRFPATALPYGVFRRGNRQPCLGVGLGKGIIDLDREARSGRIASVDPALLVTGRLNELLAAGSPSWKALREELSTRVAAGDFADRLIPKSRVELCLAWEVADYVDFYSSRHHAENVGRMFRPDQEPLLPNWLHLPVGYHGRSGTVVVDGTPIRRPAGQYRTRQGEVLFGPSRQLDIELEVGFVLGGESELGEPVPISEASRHLFGVVLLNDWSARDLQAWEYVPLGPFLGKSFATSVSAWVMPIDALESAWVRGPDQTAPVPQPHLRSDRPWGLSLDLQIWMRPAGVEAAVRIAEVNAGEALYWNAAQQLAHLTSNGATVRPGDLFGSGTVSGPEEHQRGSLLELSWAGKRPLKVAGVERSFLEDGDVIVLTGSAPGPEGPVPLGPVSGAIYSH